MVKNCFSRYCIYFLLLFAVFRVDGADFNSNTEIFNPYFRTLKTSVADNFMMPPVIRLNTEDRIIISFDEIAEDNSFLEYRLIHCNADWQPSRLVESEFLSGFNSAKIEDYAFSSNTFVHYVNYRIELPNDDMEILHSGNYLLQVYNPDEPDDTILQTRFQVSENSASPRGIYSSNTDMGRNGEFQQVSFELDFSSLNNINPYQDLLIEVQQNNVESSSRFIPSPLRVSGSTAIYEHLNQLIFHAGNEYRRFESISNGFAGMNVDSLRYMGSNYHVWLKPDSERGYRQYSYDRTQHGRFIVREYNATDSDVGADYITVHFSLKAPRMLNADVYVDGEFSHNNFTDFNKMIYDGERGIYNAEIPLKQGAYNYRYVIKRTDMETAPDATPIEGNKYETDNEYSVAVYYRPPGARADRLVGFAVISRE